MTEWRRSEPRDLRPFFGVATLERVLERAAIRLRPGDEPIDLPRIVLRTGDFEEVDVSVLPRLDTEAIVTALGKRAGSFALILKLRDPMFMHRAVVRSWSFEEVPPAEIPLEAGLLRQFGHDTNVEVSLSLSLVADRDPEPGWPVAVGSWVAKKTFLLGIRAGRSAFQIEILTPEIRKANQLPDGTMVFAEVEGSVDEVVQEGASFATVYLAEPIHAALNAERKDTALKAIVEAEIVTAVLSAMSRDLDEVTEVASETPLARVLEHLGGNVPMPLDQFRALAKDPQRLRAAVHDRTALIVDLEKL